jgi:hypothetical protein
MRKFRADVTLDLTVLFPGNDHCLSGFLQRRDTTFVGVESPVGEHEVSRDGREKGLGPRQIRCLTRGQEKIQATAPSLNHNLNSRPQPALRAPEGLLCLGGLGVLAPPFRAPAAG